MEPYLIICSSCAARLKVTNEALFGQRLACPKCQTMIEVVAPEGFKPSAPPEATRADTENSLSGNFDDIDSLLATAQSQVSAAPEKPSPQSANPSKASKTYKTKVKPKLNPLPPAKAAGRVERATTTSSAASSKAPRSEFPPPTMPGADWDTESTKQKKRILQIATLALMALVVLGIGIWALMGGSGDGSPQQTVAENNQSQPVIIQDDSDAIPKTENGGFSHPAQPTKPTTGIETTDTNAAMPSTATTNEKSAKASVGKLNDTYTSASTLQPEPPVDNSAGKSAPPPLPSATEPLQATEPKDPPSTQLLPKSATIPSGNSESPDSPLIASTENSLGALSKILRGQGTSLKQIEDIAQIQKERALIGTPTYLIERPDRKPVQVDRQLSAELSGWKLDNVPLIDAIGDLEMLSGVPVSIAPQLFRDGSIDILRPVSLQIEAITFKDAFKRLLKDDGLTVEPTASGLRITSMPDSNVVTKNYPQSFCTSERSAVRLRDLIIAVTEINDWNDDAQYQLDVSTDSVTVSHLQKNQKTVADLLTKLNAASAYKSAPTAMKKTLLPLALKAEAVLAASPELKTTNPYRRSMRIGSLLRTVRNTTGLKTVMDWENLSKQGWFPNTRLPGRIDEPSNQILLDQLGHAMELTSVVIGSDTIVLTSFENAGKQRDIEVYSVGDIIGTNMKPSQLDQLITETMGIDQLTPPNATVIYFAEAKCLVANAPQVIQRQLSSIVDELSSQSNP